MATAKAFFARARWGSRWGVVDKYHPNPHKGLDIIAPAGADVPALEGGVVVASAASSAVGWYITVQNADGNFETYAHIVPGVSVGQRVVANQTLGQVAGYGDRHGTAWTGPHIHFCRSTTVGGWATFTGTNINPEPTVLIIIARVVTSGGDGEPIRKRNSMTTIYWDGQNPTGGQARWALAGDSPGTTANFITTGDKALADKWATVHGPILDLGSTKAFADFAGWYLQPLKVNAPLGGTGGTVTATIDPTALKPVVDGLTALGVKIDALPDAIDARADGRVQGK